MTQVTPIYFAGKEHKTLFGWYHPAVVGQERAMGVVLCNTLGNESLRVHRSLRHEAELLSQNGFSVLRFDFFATGDSSGDVSESDLLETWIKDIEQAVKELKLRSGVSEVSLVGVRLGATVAAVASGKLGNIDHLVLWEPYVAGRDFLKEVSRQHKMLISLSPSGFTLDQKDGLQGGKEFLGFYLNHLTLARIEEMDLALLQSKPAKNALIIGASALPGSGSGGLKKLVEQFESLGTKVSYRQVPGYQGIFREALFSEVPFPALESIMNWLIDRTTSSAENGPRESTPTSSPRTSSLPTSSEFSEEAVFFGKDASLFGILSVPKKSKGDRSAIIILNAGVGTRIGPHRLYVQMAREWSELGYFVFRVDLSGSGDSATGNRKDESDPYPRSSLSDVREAITYLEQTHLIKHFTVTGTCSGADITFRSAVDDPRINRAIVINPRSFCTYNFPELELHVGAHKLQSTLKKGQNWLKILRGGLGSIHRIIQVLRSLSFKLKGPKQSTWPVKDVPGCFKKILARGSELLIIVSEGDPGMEYVNIHFQKEINAIEKMPGFKRIYFKGTDHLFTLKHARNQVLRTLSDYLSD